MSMGIRESSDRIHRDVSPWSFRDCIWMKRSCFGLHTGFCSLASFATLDVGFNVLLDLGPPEFSEYKLLRLLDSWMTGGDMIMTSGNDLASERGFSWDIDSSVIVEHPFLSGDSSVVSEGGSDACIPQLFLSRDFFYSSMY